jgi:sugar transferase (PEP-CTERM/EpsH1 system associated)
VTKLMTISDQLSHADIASTLDVTMLTKSSLLARSSDGSRRTSGMRYGEQCIYRRLRVLHVIDQLKVGGTEVGILNVISGLGSDCFEHRICTIRGYDETFARSRGFKGPIDIAGGSHSGFQFLLGRLMRVMGEFRPDIVHSRNWGAIEAMPAARLARIPVAIHSEHGYEVDMLRGLPTRRRILRRFAYSVTDAIFTVSEELKSYHSRQGWLPLERIRVLPNGVDTCKFARRPEEGKRARGRLGLPVGSLVLGAIGRLVPIKEQATLLQAAEILLAQGISAFVLVVGSGPDLPKLQEFAAVSSTLSGRVVFAGESSNVAALLNAIDIFVLPSRNEGMSNTLLEAMASGLPVVATRVGGNPELVEDRRSGFLFEPGDVRTLVAILERIASDTNLREECGQAARSRAIENFSFEAMIRRYESLYSELASKRGVLTAQQR